MTIDLVISTGSPAGIGPEVSLVAATKVPRTLHALQEQAQALGAEAPALQAVEHRQGRQADVGGGQGLVLGAQLGDVVPGEA